MRTISLKVALFYHDIVFSVPVLRRTWGRDAAGSIAYYSDTEDSSHSTIDTGVPNTERGASIKD